MSLDETSSPINNIYFSFVEANGIVHRLASTERNLCQTSRKRNNRHPLVLFLHGFPESWFSWRHQLLFLREEPFLAVAPDMRGYGSTTQPVSVDAYTQPVVAKDVVEIAKALGYDKFFVVGHDWGAMVAWSVSLFYPEHVIGVCGMSVPYAGSRPKAGLLTMLQLKHGRCLGLNLSREELKRAKFHYMLHHCLPHCAEEYDKNTREFMYRMYAFRPGCEVEEGTPEYDIKGLMFPPRGNDEHDRARTLDATSAPGLWQRIPRPKTPPAWLSSEDLQYLTMEFQRAGFHGGLCYYRNLDKNYELAKQLLSGKDDRIHRPSLFLIGDRDGLVKMYGGKRKVINRLKTFLPGLTRDPIFLKNCGHWIQQEEPEFVNNALLGFLSSATRPTALASRL